MKEELGPDATMPQPAADAGGSPAAENPAIETASDEYLGRWNRLVSTTNWEKGRIVAEWREALMEAGAPPAACSDEAWSRRVGSVTPQHTGRLRRVYQRFAAMRDDYRGLYWSHFQAALDWDDAEMWLEGAVQNRWSIAQMQGERSRTMGALVEEGVEAADVEVDEDSAGAAADLPPAGAAAMIDAEDTAAFESSEGAGSAAADETYSAEAEATESFADGESPAVRPFENLPRLPTDLRDAFDGFKLAIVHHRISNWQEVSLDDVLATLDALRQLALAPSEI